VKSQQFGRVVCSSSILRYEALYRMVLVEVSGKRGARVLAWAACLRLQCSATLREEILRRRTSPSCVGVGAAVAGRVSWVVSSSTFPFPSSSFSSSRFSSHSCLTFAISSERVSLSPYPRRGPISFHCSVFARRIGVREPY